MGNEHRDERLDGDSTTKPKRRHTLVHSIAAFSVVSCLRTRGATWISGCPRSAVCIDVVLDRAAYRPRFRQAILAHPNLLGRNRFCAEGVNARAVWALATPQLDFGASGSDYTHVCPSEPLRSLSHGTLAF